MAGSGTQITNELSYMEDGFPGLVDEGGNIWLDQYGCIDLGDREPPAGLLRTRSGICREFLCVRDFLKLVLLRPDRPFHAWAPRLHISVRALHRLADQVHTDFLIVTNTNALEMHAKDNILSVPRAFLTCSSVLRRIVNAHSHGRGVGAEK